MKKVRFDESLPKFVEILSREIGPEKVDGQIFLRDGIGLLTFIVTADLMSATDRRELSKIIEEDMRPYIASDGFAVATKEELFEDAIEDQSIVVTMSDIAGVSSIRLVDRRVVGADWLKKPSPNVRRPMFVFASLKGGVGRSTALCVCAAALASAGRRVLAVDMDVEAPGIGTMLLAEDTTPKYGLLDYLVESNLGDDGADLLVDMIAPSWLANGTGVVDVLPAIGLSTIANPANIMSKFARAYLDVSGGSGISQRLDALFALVDKRNEYDVILVDARAGLHETTAAAFLGIGGHILLFGTDQPQTFSAFNLLFASLFGAASTGWSDRLAIVHAKVRSSGSADNFSTKSLEMLGKWFAQIESSKPKVSAEEWRSVFDVDWDDGEAAVSSADGLIRAAEEREAYKILSVVDSDLFRDFDPLRAPDRLTRDLYEAVFGALVNYVSEAT